MRPPAGVKLTNGRLEDGELVYDLKVTRWRAAMLIVQAFATGCVRVRRG